MLIKFDVNGEPYEINTSTILNTEAIAAQKVTGMAYDDWLGAIDSGDVLAVSAFVWIAMKRRQPDLRFSDVEFPVYQTWANREYVSDTAPDEQEGEGADPTPLVGAESTESN